MEIIEYIRNILLNPGTVSVLIAIVIFFFIASIGVTTIVKQKRVLKKAETGDKTRDLYEEYIGGDITHALKKVGIDPTEYIRDCSIAGIEPNFYVLVIFRIIGVILLFGAIALILTDNIYMSLAMMMLAVLVMNRPKKVAKKKANLRKAKFDNEIPRFLDMLDSALVANMPIQNAMEFTCKYLDGVLAEEMRLALAETEMGAKGWNEALIDVANKYNNNNFSDFALDVSTAYNKGVPVIESVERKSRQIKASNLLTAKEKASSLTNQILIPTVMFKMIPIMAAFLLPVIIQFTGAGMF